MFRFLLLIHRSDGFLCWINTATAPYKIPYRSIRIWIRSIVRATFIVWVSRNNYPLGSVQLGRGPSVIVQQGDSLLTI